MSFRDLRNPDDVVEYVTSLDTRWPQRHEIIRHIRQQIASLPVSAPRVVELGSGPGILAKYLLSELPHLRYTGIDNSEPLQTFARSQLASFNGRAELIRADLNADSWFELVSGRDHVVVSMQSLHDLGDESHVSRIYGLAKNLIVPGGLFLNADLVAPTDQTNPDHPGRLSVPRHLQLLRSHGYERVSCSLEMGEFGCFGGYVGKCPTAHPRGS
jgi:SAM-dependent methyltransferase